MNNNKLPFGETKLGLDQNMAVDSSIAETQQALLEDSRPPVEGAGPSINPLPYMANNENLTPQGGTILSSTTYNVTDSGIEEVNVMTNNSTEQWERRVQQEQHQRIAGKTVYNTPVTQTPSVAPNVDDGLRITPDQLSQLRKRDRLISLNSRLKSLQVDRRRTALKLKGIDEAIRNLQTEVESM